MCDTYAPGGDKEMTPLPTNTRAAANLIFNLPKVGAAVQASKLDPSLKATCFQHLNLRVCKLLSSFNLNLTFELAPPLH